MAAHVVGDVRAHIAQVPGFKFRAGDVLLELGVADHVAIAGAVGGQPLVFRRLGKLRGGERLDPPVLAHHHGGQAGLVVRLSGLGHALGLPAGDGGFIARGLILVGAVALAQVKLHARVLRAVEEHHQRRVSVRVQLHAGVGGFAQATVEVFAVFPVAPALYADQVQGFLGAFQGRKGTGQHQQGVIQGTEGHVKGPRGTVIGHLLRGSRHARCPQAHRHQQEQRHQPLRHTRAPLLLY